jgi:hypothetical protein
VNGRIGDQLIGDRRIGDRAIDDRAIDDQPPGDGLASFFVNLRRCSFAFAV